MEPMGTITKYYPFIDEETKALLDSLMEESSSYYDFVHRLSNVVLANEVSVNLVFIAAVQVWWCRTHETMIQIQEKYRNMLCIRPYGYYHGSMERDSILKHDAVVDAIDRAIESSVVDWIEIELHLLHAFYHWPFGEIRRYIEPIERAKILIDDNPLLNCFKPLIYAFEALAKFREGAIKESILDVQRGQELAEVYDDSLFKYMNLLEHGIILLAVNVQDSLERFEESYSVVQDLEVPYLVSEVLNDSSIAYETAGEFDLAISSLHEIMRTLGDIPPSDTLWILLSRNYAILGDGSQALEWINRGIESCDPLATPTMYNLKAWALALLNRLDEAEQTLEIAHSLTIESGLEWHLGNYYHFSGVVELKKGNFLDALDLFEKAGEIAERMRRIDIKTRVLLDLARVEILIDNQSIDRTKVALPGKWLSKLETHAFERDLPGIRMYAALLKSDFYQNHSQLQDAHSTLVNALDITDSLGVATLRKRISDRIQDIDRLIQDEELVS